MDLFPAYAGVILKAGRFLAGWSAFPRLRGGDPSISSVAMLEMELFPAYAGVIPMSGKRIGWA